MSRWAELTGGNSGADYASRFASLAASGVDVHGEATLCASLVPPGSRVLDAGCGTGRVAIRLAELGYDCVGVDLDPSMLAEARRAAPAMTWIEADLAALDITPGFDLVLAAGNVVPLLAPGTEAKAVTLLAGAVRPGGLLVAGFGLDAAHLPVPPTAGLAEYDEWCAAAGLVLERRFATWDRAEYRGGGYAVSVHRRPG
ncbi:class I SAM-dependent methyltransferase [Rhizohabitans arisaemae]|uniref:class I SAM-dependent methyltransferase n=1 Tax=Rhizohabitans arisaemae TaxID=2720610 RepID=UPI0024B05C35|nr:class I SAM-dependent methyltransferase [Rhizohabitans arisaemae]